MYRAGVRVGPSDGEVNLQGIAFHYGGSHAPVPGTSVSAAPSKRCERKICERTKYVEMTLRHVG
jgi:hypothetical protein